TNSGQRGRAPLVLIDDITDGHEWPGQHRQIAVERNKFSESHRALQDLPPTQPENNRRRDAGEHLHERPKDSPESGQPHGLTSIASANSLKSSDLILLLRVRLDDADPREVFLHVGAHDAQLSLGIPRPTENMPAEKTHNHCDER